MSKKRNQNGSAEFYYNILEFCLEKRPVSKTEICQKFNLTEGSSAFTHMEELSFLRIINSQVELLPQGFSTYLAISSQKQSANQARKAIRFATWALIISIVSFISSIIFSILK